MGGDLSGHDRRSSIGRSSLSRLTIPVEPGDSGRSRGFEISKPSMVDPRHAQRWAPDINYRTCVWFGLAVPPTSWSRFPTSSSASTAARRCGTRAVAGCNAPVRARAGTARSGAGCAIGSATTRRTPTPARRWPVSIPCLPAPFDKGHAITVHIGYIECPESLRDHIGRRGLDFDDVRDAAQWPNRPFSADWLDDPSDPRGPRLLASGYTGTGRLIGVVLYPVDPGDGTWRLGTAFPLV